jgi:hypothetical protein
VLFVASGTALPFGLMGVVGNLGVARRRRCPDFASSSLLDLTLQDPSANIIIFYEARH